MKFLEGGIGRGYIIASTPSTALGPSSALRMSSRPIFTTHTEGARSGSFDSDGKRPRSSGS